ncbi:hypothetical protein ACFCV3_35200 [Kribbella sp. NPDC056345]|uniref:hypothetical protein n=1 Tax=Kribbella sp. NPDC056345 TaxID=3345789 RepID=UPI0035D81EC3
MKRLTDYETAWILGGAERVALTVFVTMATAGQLEVGFKRQRVKEGEAPLEAAEGSAALRIETAALDLLPASGLPVDEFVAQLTASQAVMALDDALAAQGVVRPRILPRFSPLHRELREQVATGLRRVAVLGVAGIDDLRLREIFENPLPEVPQFERVNPIKDNTFDGTLDRSPGGSYQRW